MLNIKKYDETSGRIDVFIAFILYLFFLIAFAYTNIIMLNTRFHDLNYN